MAEDKKALCVGINSFKNFPGASLRGCVNDSHEMASLLKDVYGFSPEDVTLLNDEKATKQDIISNLESMVDGARAGKYNHLVFSMSSHGSHVPDDDQDDEPDHKDEVFAPYDAASAGDIWDTKYFIVDDELRDLFAKTPDNTLLEVYLDTCHSGDGIKALTLDWIPRYLPPPSWKVFRSTDGLRTHGLREGLLEKGKVNHILWSACRSDQTSADARMDNDYHGAFTYYYCKHLRNSWTQLTRKQILAKVRNSLRPRFEQIPQLECDENHSGARVK
jgi:hypothetical protein